MEKEIQRDDSTLPDENKTSTTVAQSAPSVTAVESRRTGLCGYVIAPGAKHFCDRPVLASSSYCAWHRALCAVAPTSPAFAVLAADLIGAAETRAGSLPELGRFSAPPEFFDESEDDRLAGLDLPAPAIAHDE